jgi:hypothetical protein
MHFVIKAIIIFACSFPLVATELSDNKSPSKATTIDKEQAMQDSLLSISQSLDILANATVQLSKTSNDIINSQIRNDYKDLHKEILRSANVINQTISEISHFNQTLNVTSDDIPILKQRIDKLYKHQDDFSFSDFAAISITSVSVLITVLGFAIAILSLLGLRNIKRTTRTTAETIAEKVAGETTERKIDSVVKNKLEELLDEGKFTKHFERVVDAFILRNKNGSNSIDWEELDKSINWDQLVRTPESKEEGGIK